MCVCVCPESQTLDNTKEYLLLSHKIVIMATIQEDTHGRAFNLALKGADKK